MNGIVAWIVVVVSFALGMFYSGAESAFIAADRIRLRHRAGRGDARARRVLAHLERPEYLMSALLVGMNLSVTACTTAFTSIMTRTYGESGAATATAILVPTILVFNEIIPKGLALYYANRAVLAAEPLYALLSTVLRPVVAAFAAVNAALVHALPRRDDEADRVGLAEVHYHIADSREAGLIPDETHALVERALALERHAVRDVVVPLDRVEMVPVDAPASIVREAFVRTGYSRLPMYRQRRDDVVGIVSAWEVVTTADFERLRERLEPPPTVEADAPLAEVLAAMRTQGRHMMMVREAGRVVGMVTLEDILERIVGSITDEFH